MKRAIRWFGLLAGVATSVLASPNDVTAAAASEFVDGRPPTGFTVASADRDDEVVRRRAREDAAPAAPEPPAYVLALAGVLLIGHIAARRRRGAAERRG